MPGDNIAPTTLPDGTILNNPTIRTPLPTEKELFQYVFDANEGFEQVRIGYADGDTANFFLHDWIVNMLAGGFVTYNFQGERTFSVGRDELAYGSVKILPDGVISINDVPIVLAQKQGNILDNDGTLASVAAQLNLLLAAMRTAGLLPAEAPIAKQTGADLTWQWNGPNPETWNVEFSSDEAGPWDAWDAVPGSERVEPSPDAQWYRVTGLDINGNPVTAPSEPVEIQI